MNNILSSRRMLGACALLIAFVLLIVLVTCVDVRPIGPQNSTIGLAGINGWFRDLTGENDGAYMISEVLGYMALLTVPGFCLLGVWQLWQRKSFAKVDRDLYALAVFYGIVAVAYVFFEIVVVNYRPVMPEGELEASFPSSHTLLALCTLGAATVQARLRIKDRKLCQVVCAMTVGIAAVVVLTRLFSGVHWLTDILGGLLLGSALVLLYREAVHRLKA